MNRLKKLAAVALMLALCLQFVFPVFSANDIGVTFTATINTPTINVSDENQTVTVTVKASEIVGLDSITAQAMIPSGFTISAIANEDLNFLGSQYNKGTGEIAWYWDYNDDNDLAYTDLIAVVTYTVPANTPAGEYEIEFIIEELTEYYSPWEDGVTVTATLVIEEANTCEHTNTTTAYTLAGNGQHTVTVTCDDCDEPVSTTTEDCSGADDNDCTTAVACQHCGQTITEGTAHTPEEDDGDCTTAIKCSVCGTVTTEGNASHTPEADDGDCTTPIKCSACGTVTTEGKDHYDSDDKNHDCDNCDVKNIEDHTPGAAADCENDQICTECGEVLDEAKKHAWGKPSYTVNSDGTHTAIYVCGNDASHTKSDDPVKHNYTYDSTNHKCICGEVEKFTLEVQGVHGILTTVSVPYGANVMEYINALVEAGKVDISTYYQDYHDDTFIQQGKIKFDYWVYVGSEKTVDDEMTMEEDTWVAPRVSFTGWWCSNGDWTYEVDSQRINNSWALINHADYLEDGTGSDWYYFDNYGYRVEGITRVPYPTDKINGVEYKTEADATEGFIDYSSAWFVFGEDGKFLCNMTGIVEHDDTTRYVANGMIPWHYGLATDGTDYYYFIGDVDNGGNVLATGDVYMIRPNGLTINGKNVIVKGAYTFDADGKLCLYEGITKVGNLLRYYSNYCYTAKHGLIDVNVEGSTKYIYVSSTSAALVAGKEYYVPAGNSYGIVSGMYDFDENGYLVGAEYTDKNGIYLESGAYYYYKDGAKYYAGLIKYTGTASDGTVYNNDYIYVCSDGHLATGKYWITKSNGKLDAKTYLFDEFGKMDMRNGIVEENGSLYYYVNGVLACGKGLIKLDGNYYYVRSDGEVVNNREYWITNTNDYDVLARIYKFDENGVMLDVELKDKSLNGVVDGYYYVDGQVQYGAGPIVWEGNIYYVRSNGEVATGKYWTTTANEILPSGKYTFDETGKLVK